ncbi:MAG: tRNA pseudouridine(38-40) synthase TruA [Syntrophomonadaceae bacterium]|nr:tRNA pseudouridine(38-40) synthase TruA [Syntrophomonadaceae bacterium]
MTRIRATLEYEGTRYHGFQRQPGTVTVESTLLEAVKKITGEEVRLLAAGRTDAGVHARGQVIAFDTGSCIPPERFAPALNSVLPPDIRVVESREAAPRFHPRYDARGKWYRYLVYRQEAGYLFYRHLACLVSGSLDLPAMQEAAAHLVGTHDFRSFCASGSGVRSFVREVRSLTVTATPPFLVFDVQANGFLYNMVRIMVGTLLAVGKGKIPPPGVGEILAACDRSRAGQTAPAQGLYLMKVFY